jgi:hypothetical protein
MTKQDSKLVSTAHTLTHKEESILNAKPTDEVDRAKIKWPKMKYKRPKGKTEFVPKKRRRGRLSGFYLKEFLKKHGRDVKRCENPDCEARRHLQIHHKDGNPNNNSLENLIVLCRNCHMNGHKIADLVGVKDWDIGTVEER